MAKDETVVDVLGGKKVLGAHAGQAGVLLKRLRNGLPYQTFDSVRENLQLETERMQQIVGVPARTLARRKISRTFTKEESDRLYRVARIAALAADVLGEEARAFAWLRTPNRSLEGDAPVDRLDTDLGTQQVEQLLGRIDHGIFG
jgi:putative toxin-antitoxin system antitoxin component (TIGR02293 family)